MVGLYILNFFPNRARNKLQQGPSQEPNSFLDSQKFPAFYGI
jgi:hypothetical protein